MRHVTLRQLRTFTEVHSRAAASRPPRRRCISRRPPSPCRCASSSSARAAAARAHGRAARATEAGREVANAAQRIELALAECADALAALRGLARAGTCPSASSARRSTSRRKRSAHSRGRYPSVEIRLEVGNRADHHRRARSEHAGSRAHRPAAGAPGGGQGAHRRAPARHRGAARIIRSRAAQALPPSALAERDVPRARARLRHAQPDGALLRGGDASRRASAWRWAATRPSSRR